VANNVALSPPDAGRIPNAETQVPQDSVAALHRVLCGESVAEKERRVSEMILQLQLIREQLLQQQDQSKVSNYIAHATHTVDYTQFDYILCWIIFCVYPLAVIPDHESFYRRNLILMKRESAATAEADLELWKAIVDEAKSSQVTSKRMVAIIER